MSDPRSALQSKFSDASRYANFGPALMQMKVCGFRCHSATTVEVKSPITAFCGINGTGKSTLLQLAAVAYSNSLDGSESYYIKDFLVVGTLDPAPFTADARVEYRFWQEDRNLKQVTVSRSSSNSNWPGYRRRIERPVLFAGVGLYLPRIETRDLIIRYASKLHLDASEQVADHIRAWTCKIMDQSYEDMQRHTVSYSERSKVVVSVRRGGKTYSEAHMGCGEGRIQYLVTTLETLPERSFILIEEPETSLHSHAQRVFGEYLVNVSTRRGHQIFITTHSDPLLSALPSLSTVYIHNSQNNGVGLVYGLTAVEAKSLMSKGHEKALNVLVEDDVAQAILTEIVRRVNPTALGMMAIYIGGGAETLKTSIRTIAQAGLPLAVVLGVCRG